MFTIFSFFLLFLFLQFLLRNALIKAGTRFQQKDKMMKKKTKKIGAMIAPEIGLEAGEDHELQLQASRQFLRKQIIEKFQKEQKKVALSKSGQSFVRNVITVDKAHAVVGRHQKSKERLSMQNQRKSTEASRRLDNRLLGRTKSMKMKRVAVDT